MFGLADQSGVPGPQGADSAPSLLCIMDYIQHIRTGLKELRRYITALQHFKTAQFQNSQFIVDACPRQATIRHPASAWW